MEVEEQAEAADDGIQAAEMSATDDVNQITNACAISPNNAIADSIVTTSGAPAEEVEEETFQSQRSEAEEMWDASSAQSHPVDGIELEASYRNSSETVGSSQNVTTARDEMWDAASSSTSTAEVATASTPEPNRVNNSSLEPEDVESIEMLVMDEAGEPELNHEAGDSDDPLEVSSDVEDEADNDEHDDAEEGVEEAPAVSSATLRAERDRLHEHVLASEYVRYRDRFNSLHNQRLLQLRRAILSIESNRYPRITGEGDGEFQPEDADADDRMGRGENENEPDENQQQMEPENSIRFDTNLPAEHSYLGANMNRVSGVEYLDVGEEYNMMLFLHQHIVYPGEVLPFMISGTIIDADIDSTNGLLFGVCFPFMCSKDNENILYGVTCQIYEKGTDARGNTLIKSRALQRFITTSDTQVEHLEYITDNPTLKHGHVRILPEIYLREPLQCIDMGSMNRFRGIPSMEREFQRYQAATTSWPVHIYNYYNISSIIEKARQSLAQHKIDTMPTDPIQLSFWLARNLHLSEDMMKNIFMNDTVNLRMKLISSTFKEESIFVCRICGNRIANCRELFAMSKHGVQTQYCNSAGYIHETNTVYQLLRDAVSYSGEPSSEFSWFPGYQWHIIVCKVCTRHIGWEFKALESNLVPKSFFGISSSSVRISDSNRPPTNPREEIFRNFMRLARREVQ